MLAAVSHDLRSPLAAIKASVTDLLDPEVDAHRTRSAARCSQTIDAETDRLDTLVANLLDMSRIEAGVLQARTGAGRPRGGRDRRGRCHRCALAGRATSRR